MTTPLRTLISQRRGERAAGVWDGLSGMLAEQVGFRVLFGSGLAVAASLGLPDFDLYTMSENLASARSVLGATARPLISDIDHGYGDVAMVRRTVREFESAGASGVIIEDQASPKRCPICVDDPVTVVPAVEAVDRVRGAVSARRSEDTLIIARTDSSGEDALRRAVAFAEAGADLVMPVSRTFSSLEEWARCADETPVPLVACLTPSTWVEREFTDAVMRDLRIGLALLPFQSLYASIRAMRDVYAELAKNTAPADLSVPTVSHDEYLQAICADNHLRNAALS